ncbi:MAG: hypothetical protein IPJ20_23505 [Flammeovirgaceae bacterium]|nr:hypothetical protein [Flammeovirgaceae bacterium]
MPLGLQPTLIQQMNTLNILTAPIESYTKFNSIVIKAGLFLYDNVITGVPYVKQRLAYSGTGAFVLSSVSGKPTNI